VAGIALGVAAVLVILSVMNGLELEFQTRLLTLTEHVKIWPDDVDSVPELAQRIAADPSVLSAVPFTEVEAMLAVGSVLRPALVRGLNPESATADHATSEIVGADALRLLEPGSRRVLLGRFLAVNLNVSVGDYVTILLADLNDGRPNLTRTNFEVAGIFYAGVTAHDTRLALVSLPDASALVGLGDKPQGIAVRLGDPQLAAQFQRDLAAEIGPGFRFSNWAQDNSSLLRAMAIEKAMMTIILMFIVAVAAFNIVASLMMVVNEKQRDIAILRTFGVGARRIVRVFAFQGAVLGLIGTLLGTVIGLVLAFNVETIVPWLEQTLNFKIMPGDVFYVTEIPSDIRLADVVFVPLAALVITLLATLYPSGRAALVSPADALRDE
jgi:lipoprotein-releasing system permease protein